jgi:hypothetical protein
MDGGSTGYGNHYGANIGDSITFNISGSTVYQLLVKINNNVISGYTDTAPGSKVFDVPYEITVYDYLQFDIDQYTPPPTPTPTPTTPPSYPFNASRTFSNPVIETFYLDTPTVINGVSKVYTDNTLTTPIVFSNFYIEGGCPNSFGYYLIGTGNVGNVTTTIVC